MAKWSGTADSGILRKRAVKDKHEELLVFGYACKLFRDDEKALYIDQGKHLIPWMADYKLKIDRYDCRGALSELTQYEASREGYDATRWLGLSDSERRLEQLCDEERYFALRNNDEEEELYKEEELKRLHQKGSEFQYNYDVPADPENSLEAVSLAEEEDEEFVPPPGLDVPSDMTVPKTVKTNARIEKTAIFVSKQGPQMEILIKTKQADNPQFNFMNQDDPLYKYYKHLLTAVKTGRYKIQSSEATSDNKHEDSSEHDTSAEDHYLHPSLLATSVQSAAPPLPTVHYKPSADCAYSQLVNRIQGTQSEVATPPPPEPTQAQIQQMTYEQQQQYYQQYYYAAQYYEYCKQMMQQYQSHNQTQNFPSGGDAQNQHFDMNHLAQSQMAYAQYMQQHQANNPYAQIVSNLSQTKDAQNPYNALTCTAQQSVAPNSDIAKAPILYNQGEKVDVGVVAQTPAQPATQVAQKVTQNIQQLPQTSSVPATIATAPLIISDVPKTSESIKPEVKNSLLPLAEYGSDSENTSSSDEEEQVTRTVVIESNFKVPPGETQLIIDKMASYVSKNGKDFENIVKLKGDTRFDFLDESHEYNSYYKHKISEFMGLVPKSAEKDTAKSGKEKNGVSGKSKEKKIIAPVSFSIKKHKEETPKEIKSALPIEESDDETEEEPSAKTSPPSPAVITATTVASSTSHNPSLNSNNLASSSHLSLTPPPRIVSVNNSPEREISIVSSEIIAEVDDKAKVETSSTKIKKSVFSDKNKIIDVDDPILEMIDLTEDLDEKREVKRVEDHIKDKIISAAREKLALQLERKKKAAAFLKLKSADSRYGSTKSNSSESKTIEVVHSKSKHNEKDYYRKRHKRAVERDSVEEKSKRHKSTKTKENDHDAAGRVIDDSDSEEGEIKKHKKSSKKKKSHKRKHSKSRHESKGHHKKSKKHRRRSESHSSNGSNSS